MMFIIKIWQQNGTRDTPLKLHRVSFYFIFISCIPNILLLLLVTYYFLLVLAFTGAPASFPVQPENRDLQKFLVWTDKIASRALSFIRHVLPVGAFIGIHLRNGVDWVSVSNRLE